MAATIIQFPASRASFDSRPREQPRTTVHDFVRDVRKLGGGYQNVSDHQIRSLYSFALTHLIAGGWG
ncbi:hypothetical protein [Lysobacter sp. HA35]